MFNHVSVMLEESMEMLSVHPGGIYCDGTLGGGGHSEAILKRLCGTGHLYGIDRDRDALRAAGQRLAAYSNFTAIQGNFHDMPALLRAQGVERADGILLDLGVSSYQLDTPERGFSYHHAAPLDMRMDQGQALTAAEAVNTWPEAELERILREYGEEKWSARIAKIICEHRAQAPLVTTMDLVNCVDSAIPRAVRQKDQGHSARRTFQALRIAVNDELGPLKRCLFDLVQLLSPGGRLAVITFHSLEDRIVKQTLRTMERPCQCPAKAPVCICGYRPQVKVLRSGGKPGGKEVESNLRARSAMLRGCERLDAEWNLPASLFEDRR